MCLKFNPISTLWNMAHLISRKTKNVWFSDVCDDEFCSYLYEILGTIVENFWRFEIWKILFVCSFLEATLDFDYHLKKSGWGPFNLGFLIKINNFMKKMNPSAWQQPKSILILWKIRSFYSISGLSFGNDC